MRDHTNLRIIIPDFCRLLAVIWQPFEFLQPGQVERGLPSARHAPEWLPHYTGVSTRPAPSFTDKVGNIGQFRVIYLEETSRNYRAVERA